MKDNPILTIWFQRESKQFYQIPRDVLFTTGEIQIERFDGVQKNIALSSLTTYQIDIEHAETLLKDHYTTQLEASKKATLALTEFSVITGKTKDGLDQLLETEKSPLLNDTQAWLSDFMKTVNNKDTSEEQQKRQFQDTMGKIPELLSFFGEEELKKAAENPEEWANSMQEKVFGENNRAKKEIDKEKLQQEINEQIRANIEKAMKQNKK